MNSNDVLKIYNDLQVNDINIWIDGGWCVDALLGKQTREHPDLDIAVNRKCADKLHTLLLSWGYKDEIRKDTSDWNFVLKDSNNRIVDVHVFEFDENGKSIYGIEYDHAALTGKGTIEGQAVNCIDPKWMFKYKTAYKPAEKDLKDVQALSDKFGFVLPGSHRPV